MCVEVGADCRSGLGIGRRLAGSEFPEMGLASPKAGPTSLGGWRRDGGGWDGGGEGGAEKYT